MADQQDDLIQHLNKAHGIYQGGFAEAPYGALSAIHEHTHAVARQDFGAAGSHFPEPHTHVRKGFGEAPEPVNNAVHEAVLYEGAEDGGGPQDYHAHMGHSTPHHIGLGHRPHSQDPLHGEETKLYGRLKDLRDKAGKGQASQVEMAEMRDIHGKMAAIQHSRALEASRIAGRTINSDNGPAALSTPIKDADTMPGSGMQHTDRNDVQMKALDPYNPLRPSPANKAVNFAPQPMAGGAPMPHAWGMPPTPVMNKEANENSAPGVVPEAVAHDPLAVRPKAPEPIELAH